MIGLIEAGLSLIPVELRDTPKVLALSKRFNVPREFIFLDVSLFHHEMRKYGIDLKRGRPDIVHMFLLAAQYSPLNIKGNLRTFVHTVENKLITIRPETRVPKNYYQFVNLMQKLYMFKKVPPRGKWLMKLDDVSGLSDVLSKMNIEKPILMHERGERLTCEMARNMRYPPYAFLLGGFQRGDFDSSILSAFEEKRSIKGGMPLDAWIVADRLIACLEGDIV